MRPLLLSTATLVGAAAVSSQLVLPLFRGPHHQVPLMDPAGPGPALPPSSDAPAPPSGTVGGEVVLSDVMGRDRSINLFAGYFPSPPPRNPSLTHIAASSATSNQPPSGSTTPPKTPPSSRRSTRLSKSSRASRGRTQGITTCLGRRRMKARTARRGRIGI